MAITLPREGPRANTRHVPNDAAGLFSKKYTCGLSLEDVPITLRAINHPQPPLDE